VHERPPVALQAGVYHSSHAVDMSRTLARIFIFTAYVPPVYNQ